ncbi:hypothetical protein GCM10023168_36430 [Fodinibacter luteus]|uniref:Uncharacterized protein n=1 Tax=Fodinibacter luteus TaxID=552064 RepID=A0ABP8KRH0_9MICO
MTASTACRPLAAAPLTSVITAIDSVIDRVRVPPEQANLSLDAEARRCEAGLIATGEPAREVDMSLPRLLPAPSQLRGVRLRRCRSRIRGLGTGRDTVDVV